MRSASSKSQMWQFLLLALLIPVLLAGLSYANYQFSLQAPGGNDFLPRYLGSRALLLEGTSPYDPSVSEEAQRSIYGRLADPEAGEDVAHFVYPLPIVLFVGPFSLLPFPIARALWMTLLQISLPLLFLLGIHLSRWRPGPIYTTVLLLFSVFWYFGFRAMILGQFAVLEALVIAAGLLLVRRQNDFWAGLFFGLSILKPQVPILLIPLTLIWGYSRRRWTLVTSILGWIGALTVSFMLIIPDWPFQWLYQVLDYPTYTYPGSPLSIIIGWLPIDGGLITPLLSVGLLVYLFWTWFQTFGKQEPAYQWAAAMTLVVTQLIAPRTATTNFLVFVPGMLLIFGVIVDRWDQTGRAIVGSLLAILLVAPWALFLLTILGDREHPIMHVPFPLLMLIGLWWTRWWLVRPNTVESSFGFNLDA